MVLDFGLKDGLFPQTAESGEGLDAIKSQAILEDLGSQWKRANFLIDALPIHFRSNPATGTVYDSEKINDGITTTIGSLDMSPVNYYAEIKYDFIVRIQRFRQYGFASTARSSKLKVQYFNIFTGLWIDWITDINVKTDANAWSDYIVGPIVITNKVRIVVTTLDREALIREAEVIY